MDICGLQSAELKRLNALADNMELTCNDDVRTFVTAITKLIYDYKMLGKVFDFYAEDVEYHKQDKTVFKSIHDVARNIGELCAAFPNLQTSIKSIIVYKVNDDFYKASKRLLYCGNNYGPSKFGPPTGKSLSDKCQSMSIMHLKRINGKWKITFEINSDSQAWLEEVQTLA